MGRCVQSFDWYCICIFVMVLLKKALHLNPTFRFLVPGIKIKFCVSFVQKSAFD